MLQQEASAIRMNHSDPNAFHRSPAGDAEHRDTEQKLRQVQKIEALGRFAGGIMHDFNNLLTVIVGYSQLLLEQPEIGLSARRRVQQILDAGFRAASLTGQLLAFSRKQLPQPITLNLNRVIENSSKLIRFLIGDDIEVQTLLAADLANVNADPSQMEQLIINFCVNARDAMPQGGRILIETSSVEVNERWAEQHFPVRPGRYVRLSVTDTGVGMDQETLAQIFEPFFTTKAPDKGTGLGLATVHFIVRQCGGHVWADSEPGQGAAFFVYLPVATAAGPLPTNQSTQLRVLRGSETVLIVEDARPLRELIRGLLEGFGYTVLEAEDARRARQIAEQHQDIAVLLIDVSLPGTSGLVLATALREKRPRLKVLQMTVPPSGFVNYGFQEPGTDSIQKPFTAEALALKLRSLLDAMP
jgi:two-component system cell cycle sensor histidine kinase/response regulator CckA